MRILTLLLTVPLWGATIPTAYILNAGSPLYTNLAAAWPINEASGGTITDKRNSIACTQTGTATPSWTTNDTSGPALSFPGGTSVSAGLDCGTPAAVQDIGNGHTASWFFRFRVASGVVYNLMQRNDSNVAHGWKIGQVSGGFLAYKQERASTNLNATYSSINGTLSTGWHDLAIIYDGTQNASGVAIYLDGTLQTQSTSTNGNPAGTTSDAANHLLLACTTFDTVGELQGIMDIAYIWRDRQLTSTEISSLHATPYQLFVSPGSPARTQRHH